MMRSLRGRIALAAIAALALGLSAVGPAAGNGGITVIASGLKDPRGIDVGPLGLLFVAEAAAGRIDLIVNRQVVTFADGLPSVTSPEGETTGVVNVDVQGGRVYAAIGGGPQDKDPRFDTLVRVTPWRTTIAGDLQAYRNAHPQPACDPKANPEIWCDLDQPANPTDSNAYGLAALRSGFTLLTDAAGNELVLVKPSGRIVSIAKFPNQIVSTAHLPPQIGETRAKAPAEPVPTSVTVGPDGFWYVGELKGYPFTPGTSRIWRIAPWARNVTCDPNARHGSCTLWKDGFTSIIDLQFGPDHALYVGEIVKGGVGNLFFGGDTTGGLIRVARGNRTELAAGQLPLVGGVAVGSHGVFVTTGATTNDGKVVRIAG